MGTEDARSEADEGVEAPAPPMSGTPDPSSVLVAGPTSLAAPEDECLGGDASGEGTTSAGTPSGSPDDAAGTIGSDASVSFDDLLAEAGIDPATFEMSDTFGALTVAEFAEDGASPNTEGVHVLAIESVALRRLLAFTELSIADTEQESPFTQIELTASRGQLAGRSFERGTFSVCVIPLLSPTSSLSDGASVAFVVSHRALAKAVGAAGAVVHLTFDANTNHLTFRSGRFERPMKLMARNRFVAPDLRELGSDLDLPPRTIPTATLARALAFTAPFLPKDDAPRDLCSVEVRDGAALGGTEATIAHLGDSAFAGWDFRIDRGHVARLQAALPFLGETVEQTETAHYIRLTGESAILGVARPTTPFRSCDLTLPLHADRELVAPKVALLHRLKGLQATQSASFRLRAPRSKGKQVRAVLSAPATADAGEHLLRTSIQIDWRSLDPRPFSLTLPLAPVLRALEVLDGSSVYLRFPEHGSRLILHTGAESAPTSVAAVHVGLPRADAPRSKRAP